MNRSLYLIKVDKIDDALILRLKKDLKFVYKEIFKSIEISPHIIKLRKEEYHPLKRQYNGSMLLKRISALAKKEKYFRALGLVNKDIYSGFLNFVFGIAQKPKTISKDTYYSTLVSLIRLDEKFYHRAHDIPLFELRALKEAIHELGHTFGLSHCENKCVMKFSNHLMDTDKKPLKYCSTCSDKISRYLSLLNDLNIHG